MFTSPMSYSSGQAALNLLPRSWNAISFDSAISSCSWALAQHLLSILQYHQLRPERSSYNRVCGSCELAEQAAELCGVKLQSVLLQDWSF